MYILCETPTWSVLSLLTPSFDENITSLHTAIVLSRNQLIYRMAYSTSLIVLTDLLLNIYSINWEKLQINV